MQKLGLAGADVVEFAEVARRVRSERELRTEAAGLVESHGPNAYSDFLLRNARRPTRDEAATIGRLMGVRVRAADGTLQPQKAKADRAAARRAKQRQRTESDYIDQILRFRCALANLSQNDGDPADVIRYMDPLFGDILVIREQLSHAVQWINRFAEEWRRKQETCGGAGQV
jgi:hypothetical protein